MEPSVHQDGKITFVIADDNEAFRVALRLSLDGERHVLVASVCDGAEAIAAVERHKPDILLLDISMPVMDGFQAAEYILKSYPSVRIIFVSAHTENDYVEGALKRGVAGYVGKHRLDEIADAIPTVLAGQIYRPTFAA